MPKATHQQRYETFLTQLREARAAVGMTQIDVAQKLGSTQTFISKCERGERRLDVIDLIDFLEALDTSPEKFVANLYGKLESQ